MNYDDMMAPIYYNGNQCYRISTTSCMRTELVTRIVFHSLHCLRDLSSLISLLEPKHAYVPATGRAINASSGRRVALNEGQKEV